VDLLLGGSHAVNDPYGELALDEVELFNRVLTTNEMTAITFKAQMQWLLVLSLAGTPLPYLPIMYLVQYLHLPP
jgi:hypothetical protein